MPETTHPHSPLARRAPWAIAGLVVAAGSAAMAAEPVAVGAPNPVSPGSSSRVELAASRCPTFHWAQVPGADGYELRVFELGEVAGGDDSPVSEEAEPTPVLGLQFEGAVSGWTPPLGSCLERGARYAWAVRAWAGAVSGPWSEPALFEVPGRRRDEEAEALEALRPRRRSVERDAREEVSSATAREASREQRREGEDPSRAPHRLRIETAEEAAGKDGAVRSASASAPSPLGDASLHIEENLELGPSSNVFKNGELMLWDDAHNNLALGRLALGFNSIGTHSTAVGAGALRFNTGSPIYGSYNTAVGSRALFSNTVGDRNTAVGYGALVNNTEGFLNTAVGAESLFSNQESHFNAAVGFRALRSHTTGTGNTAIGPEALEMHAVGEYNTAVGMAALGNGTFGTRNTAVGWSALLANTGDDNIAIGTFAGFALTTGSHNIAIGAGGSPGESDTIRIGAGQTATFVAGISGTTVTGAPVLVNSSGKLGTSTSSRRFKQDIRDLDGGDLSARLRSLRPVAFRYRPEVVGDAAPTQEYGLIAEEVAEVLPELVLRDAEGRPSVVRYHLLTPLLLAEVQRLWAETDELALELEKLRRKARR